MERLSKPRRYLKRAWHFIWEEDSIWSWIVNIILAFVLIKFIIYPGLAFALQTSHPIVAVVSGSMEHKIAFDRCLERIDPTTDRILFNCRTPEYKICGNTFGSPRNVNLDAFWEQCGDWYEQNAVRMGTKEFELGITENEFSKFRFKNGFNTGDIMILYSAKKVNVGDTVVYNGGEYPIIHRVVSIGSINGETVYITKGDHNEGNDPAPVTTDKVIGKAVVRIPYLGYIKIYAVKGVCLLEKDLPFCTLQT